MKMIIELESLDDLINLIGLARCVEPKEPKKQEAPKPVAKEPLDVEMKRHLTQAWEDYKRRKEQSRIDERLDFLNCSIDILRLKPAAESALINHGVTKVRDLLACSILELKRLPNVGKVSINTIKEILGRWGISLKESP